MKRKIPWTNQVALPCLPQMSLIKHSCLMSPISKQFPQAGGTHGSPLAGQPCRLGSARSHHHVYNSPHLGRATHWGGPRRQPSSSQGTERQTDPSTCPHGHTPTFLDSKLKTSAFPASDLKNINQALRSSIKKQEISDNRLPAIPGNQETKDI